MILIEPEAHVPRSALPKRELSRFLARGCERVGLLGEVTVLITTDERMRELNQTFRRQNKPTDVLSFPPAPAAFAGDSAGGDLAISADTAMRQARSMGHPLLVEVKILLLHGLLHLSGMDHEQDTGQMGRLEAKLRREFELPAGLIQRSVRVSAVRSARASAAPTSPRRGVRHPTIGETRRKAGGKAASTDRAATTEGAGSRLQAGSKLPGARAAGGKPADAKRAGAPIG